jgi:NitT/TauT family transport system substrate-binding protein
MSKLPRSFITSAVALCAAAAVAGPALAQGKVWRHGIVEAKSDAGFVFMASHLGLLDKRGIKLEMMQFKGDALALRAMLAGELESYEGSPGGPIIAASRGADIKLVGCYWPGLTYGLVSRKEVGSAADLKGKNIAISSPGALPDLFARAVLERNNIPGEAVKFAALGSDTDRFRAVAAGVVDAAAVSTEFVPVIESMGMKLLVHAHDVVPDYLRFCTYMTSKTIAARGEEAAQFLAAEIEGFRHALNNREETTKLARKLIEAKDDDKRADYVFDEVIKYSAVNPDMPIPAGRLTWMQDLLIKTGNLDKPADIAKLIDGSVREKALALAGPGRK